MPLKVIGAGFGRTGTQSLKIALERLNFGPCYHLFELLRNPKHYQLWENIVFYHNLDFSEIFKNFKSAVDWPASAYWKELYHLDNSTKVILTVRDPRKWYQSMRNTIYKNYLNYLSTDDDRFKKIGDITLKPIFETIFQGAFEDKIKAIHIFNEHIANVKEQIPEKNLLIYTIGSGWDPLCKFLETAIPADNYPNVNTTEEFIKVFNLQ